jgi:hypothetical protein
MSNQLALIDCLMILQAAFPQREMGAQTLQVYQHGLADIPPQLLHAAVARYIGTRKFPPAISEIRGAAAAILLENAGVKTAPEAWESVTREISRVGHWGQPDLDPLTARAVRQLGGWKALCTGDNVVADRARFVQFYNSLRDAKALTLQQLPAAHTQPEEEPANRHKIDAAITNLRTSINGSAKPNP